MVHRSRNTWNGGRRGGGGGGGGYIHKFCSRMDSKKKIFTVRQYQCVVTTKSFLLYGNSNSVNLTTTRTSLLSVLNNCSARSKTLLFKNIIVIICHRF